MKRSDAGDVSPVAMFFIGTKGSHIKVAGTKNQLKSKFVVGFFAIWEFWIGFHEVNASQFIQIPV